MTKRNPEEVAVILAKFYKDNFYGKEDSKYRIKKDQIKVLAGDVQYDSEFRKEIRNELRKLGYVMVMLVDEYIILKEAPLNRCRAVKKAIIEKLACKKKNIEKDCSKVKKPINKKKKK